MNKAEKQVARAVLDAEKKQLRELKAVFNQARKDTQEKIIQLSARIAVEPQNLQTIIYQIKYQQMIQQQLDNALHDLQQKTYESVDQYLRECYNNGYVGTMYSISAQGIPLTVPIDQKRVADALNIDSKISEGLYTRMGEDVKRLKNSIRAEVSRSIANGESWYQLAQHIAKGMNSPFDAALSRTMTIARTEGHRVQENATMDAAKAAMDKGANQLKQWDSALDERVRPAHREADGQLRELDEPFTVMGEQIQKPGEGSAANCINCRCHMLLRARWELDESELEILKERAKVHEVYGIKNQSYKEYKDKYLKLPANADKTPVKVPEKTTAPKTFTPAKDIKEVCTRVSSALGVPEDAVSFGRMKVELANEYLEGIEEFVRDFPQIKGLYTAVNTKNCRGGTLGVNAMTARGRYDSDWNIVYDCALELGFKSPKNLGELRKTYEFAMSTSQHYKNTTPKSTAIHELVHGLTHAVEMKRHGFFDDGVLKTTINKSDWHTYSSTNAHKIVEQAKQEVFGKTRGHEVFEGMEYLGTYAFTNSDETIAQAISYEYANPEESNVFGRKMIELLKKDVNEVFK